MEQVVNIGLIAAYVLIVVGAVGAIVLPLINSLSHPKSLIYTFIGVAVLGIVFLIGWGLSGAEVTPHYTRYGVQETSSKVIGGAIITMYILIISALVGIAFTEVSKIFK